MIIGDLGEAVGYFLNHQYVSAMYRFRFSRSMNWKNPTRYTEKIHIFKISKEAESLAPYVDKFKVRKYVAKTIGARYLVPLLAVNDRVSDIDLDSLPRSFVLKTTHGSGWNIICKDKNKLNWSKARQKLSTWMRSNYYNTWGRERQYKNIKPKIICEQYLSEGKNELTDYKIYCFSGKPYCIRVMTGRYSRIRKSFYSLGWKLLPFTFFFKPPVPPALIPKPKNLRAMVHIASKLSAPFRHVRVDLYNVRGKIYFGELTFTPSAGADIFDPGSYDEVFGSLFTL